MPQALQEDLLEHARLTETKAGDMLRTASLDGDAGFHVVVNGIARLEGQGSSMHRGPGTVVGLTHVLLGSQPYEKAVAETDLHTFFIEQKVPSLRLPGCCPGAYLHLTSSPPTICCLNPTPRLTCAQIQTNAVPTRTISWKTCQLCACGIAKWTYVHKNTGTAKHSVHLQLRPQRQ